MNGDFLKYLAIGYFLVTCRVSYGQECGCDLLLGPGNNFVDAGKVDIGPGDTICIAAGTRTHLSFLNLVGTPEEPIVVINCGGRVIIENYFLGYGIKFQNSNYIKLTGSGDTAFLYGIKLAGTHEGAPGVQIGDLSSDFEVAYLEITNVGFAGIMAKTDPSCNGSSNRGYFYMKNLYFHDNYLHDIGGEGLYIGNSFYSGINKNCNGKNITLFPHDIIGLRVYNNIVENTGWDGIQVGCASEDAEIYNNKVIAYGLTGGNAHTNGIQVGEGTTGKVYNNIIRDGKGNGIIVLGLGNNYLFNNVIIRPGGYGAFCDSRETVNGSDFAFINNTIIEPASGGILNYSEITNNIYYNNIISGPNNGISSIGEFAGNLLNVILIDPILGSSLYFVDVPNDDYHLNLLSPAINTGTNVSGYGVLFDNDYQKRPAGAYDAGAYEYGASGKFSKPSLKTFSQYVNCHGNNDGTIHVEGYGGSPPYTYKWSNGDSGQTINGLPPGQYNVTVTDSEEESSTYAITMIEPEELTSGYSIKGVSCYGKNDGAVVPDVDGGSPPYKFAWSTGSSENSLKNAKSGNYSVTISDRNNCKISKSFTIGQPAPVEANYEVKPVSCPGGNDGTINIEMKNGMAPFKFNWSNGNTSKDLQDISAGFYSVTITDNNNCSIEKKFSIAQPDSFKISYEVNHARCYGENNGGIKLSAEGDAPPYKFTWSTGDTLPNLQNLDAGNYSVTVTDSNHCAIKKKFQYYSHNL